MADEERAAEASPEPALTADAPPPPDADELGGETADAAGTEPGEPEGAPRAETESQDETQPDEPRPDERGEQGGPTDDVVATPEAAAASAPPEPTRPPPDLTAERLDTLLLEVERLNVRVEELTRLGQRHMEHIDRLHAENQQLRAGELRQAVAPLLRALVRHHDNVAKMAEAAGEEGPEGAALRDVRYGLMSVLSMAGVEAFGVAAKEAFDPSRHQGVSRADTDDPDLDGTVAQMRRCGFVADDGRIVRPAEVDVYRLRQPQSGPQSVSSSSEEGSDG